MKNLAFITICLLVFIAPLKHVIWISDSMNIQRLLACFLVFFFALDFTAGLMKIDNVLLLAVVLLGAKVMCFCGSAVFGFSPNYEELLRDVRNILLLPIVARVLDSNVKIRLLSFVVIAVFTAANLLMIYGYFFNTDILVALGSPAGLVAQGALYPGRGGFGNPVDYGVNLSWITPLVVLPLTGKRGMGRLLLFVPIYLIFFASVLLTFSRIGVTVFLILTVLILYREQRLRYGLGMAVLIVAVGAMALPSQKQLKTFMLYRLESALPSNIEHDGSFRGRQEVLTAGLTSFARSPLFGVGTGNIDRENERLLGRRHGTESMYVQILCENGIVYFLVCILGIAFLYTKRKDAAGSLETCYYRRAYGYSFVAILLAGLMHPSDIDPLLYIFLGCFFSLAVNRRISTVTRMDRELAC